MNFLAVGTALLVILVAGAYGQYISCYGCTSRDDPNCATEANQYTKQKGECVSCYTSVSKDKRQKGVKIYRGCSKRRCDPSTQNMPSCNKSRGKYMCRLCCDSYLCNNQAAASIFLQGVKQHYNNGASKITAFGVIVTMFAINFIL